MKYQDREKLAWQVDIDSVGYFMLTASENDLPDAETTEAFIEAREALRRFVGLLPMPEMAGAEFRFWKGRSSD